MNLLKEEIDKRKCDIVLNILSKLIKQIEKFIYSYAKSINYDFKKLLFKNEKNIQFIYFVTVLNTIKFIKYRFE